MDKMVILVQMVVKDQRVHPDHQDLWDHQDLQDQLDMALLDQRYHATMRYLSYAYSWDRVVQDGQATQDLVVTQARRDQLDLKDSLELLDQ